MNVVLGVQRDGHWREVRLDDYSTPQGEELRAGGRTRLDQGAASRARRWTTDARAVHLSRRLALVVHGAVPAQGAGDPDHHADDRGVRRVDRRRAAAAGALGPRGSGVDVGRPRAESDATRVVSRSRGRAMVVGPASAGRASARDGASRGGDPSEAARPRVGAARFGRRIRPSCVLRERGGDCTWWRVVHRQRASADRVTRALPVGCASSASDLAGIFAHDGGGGRPGATAHPRSSNSRPILVVKNGGSVAATAGASARPARERRPSPSGGDSGLRLLADRP